MEEQKLKVCFPVNELLVGGAERQLIDLAKGLDPSRFEPWIVTLYPGGPLEQEVADHQSVRLVTLDRRGKYDPGTLFRLAQFLRRERIDIVQPFLTPAAFFGLLAALAARTPVRIVTERAGVRNSQHLGYRAYRFAEDLLAKFASAMVANSKAGKDFLASRGVFGSRVRVIYNGVDEQRLQWDDAELTSIRRQLDVPADGLVLVTVASLTPAKDHLSLLKAVASLRQELPGIRLAFVGDGPLRQELEAAAAQLGVGGHVTFFGRQARVGAYLAASDLAVLPSTDHEGCSNFLLESMVLGKAVVATDTGGNREIVQQEKNGFLVPAGQPPALAQAIRHLAGDPSGRRRMGEYGRRFARASFSLSRMVEEYERLYVELAGDRRRAVRHEKSTATLSLPG